METSFTFSVPNCFLRDSAKHLGKVLILMKSSNQNKTFLSAKLSSNDKLPQGLSLIATICRDSAKKICGKMWNILNSLTSKQNFYWVQRRRLAFSNPSLSSLSQSLTCTASGWDGCFRVSPNSIRQIQLFSRFIQFLSWTFYSKFKKLISLMLLAVNIVRTVTIFTNFALYSF